MSRPTFLAVLLVLLALPAGLPLRGFAAERAEVELRLTASAARAELGDTVTFRVEVHRRRGKPLEVNAPRLARNSVALRIAEGGRTHEVTRIHGTVVRSPEGVFSVNDDPPPRAELRRGKALEVGIPVLAILAGKWEVRAVYRGLPEEEELVSDPVEVLVEPVEGRTAAGAVIETSEGTLRFELWPEGPFNTVLNFLTLASDRFYDGLVFHRIVEGFMIQGGDPKMNGTGNPGWYIPAELDASRLHVRGVISMARTPAEDSAGSQFFVMDGAKPALDGKYAAFGRLVEGGEVLAKLAALPVVPQPGAGERSKPEKPPVIRSVRVLAR